LEKIKLEVGETAFGSGNYTAAARLFDEIIKADELAEFLTLKAYEHLD
jgi:malate synthase